MDRNESVEHQMTSEIGKQVFTTNGVYVGTVRDITLDVEGDKATKLAVNEVNPELFDSLPRNRGLLVPYRWVRATEDVVLVADIVERIELPDEHKSTANYRTVRDTTDDVEADDVEAADEPRQRAD